MSPSCLFSSLLTESTTTTSTTTTTTTTATTTTSTPPHPTIQSISPDKGIVAGRTRITVTGQNFPELNILMSYGNYDAASMEPCSQTVCFVMTEPGDSSDIGVQLPISLTFQGQTPITTPFTFTYKSNPQVNSANPLKTLAAGGTTLTVHGEGFDSVNDAQLIVHMVHTIKDSGIRNETTFTSSCTVNASDTLKCLTPELIIPEHFKAIAFGKAASVEQTSRADYYWNIEGESLEFYLGLKLDGDQSYTNLKESLPQYSQIKVYILEPEFDVFQDTKEVNSNEHLQITGKRLSDGLDITDYKVQIGLGTCNVVDMTANELICVIPEEEILQEDDVHSVHVFPGTNLSPQLIGNVIFYLLTFYCGRPYAEM